MPLPFIPTAVIAAVSFAAKQKAAQLALAIAIAIAAKVLKAAAKEGGKQAARAVDRFEEAARRYEDLAAAEPEGKKRLQFSAIAVGAKAAAASFRELSHLIEQNADDTAVESAVARATGNLKQLASRRQEPTTTE